VQSIKFILAATAGGQKWLNLLPVAVE
jgi:hypothetical protein